LQVSAVDPPLVEEAVVVMGDEDLAQLNAR
jgi:hypothetical protein